MAGSSPLARGLPEFEVHCIHRVRIIPARAGFTFQGRCNVFRGSDHPRSRGVYTTAPSPPSSGMGSSPLARGLRIARGRLCGRLRIIPARAGFTPAASDACSHRWDHPRSRGVYRPRRSRPASGSGSSPLARGLRALDPVGGASHRIIPARAGFTWCTVGRRRPRPDHPRSRGVYGAKKSGDPKTEGSSPLARGLPCSRTRTRAEDRIIPARAGFTPPVCGDVHKMRDHPRSRGVYLTASLALAACAGSSPLARGLPVPPKSVPALNRIIPARAGFTTGALQTSLRSQDHPRSRGVYAGVPGAFDTILGSSPLARGLPITGNADARTRRIIPARAGFTGGHAHYSAHDQDHPRSRGVYAHG